MEQQQHGNEHTAIPAQYRLDIVRLAPHAAAEGTVLFMANTFFAGKTYCSQRKHSLQGKCLVHGENICSTGNCTVHGENICRKGNYTVHSENMSHGELKYSQLKHVA
jgi:hypothetical protein